MSLSCEHGWDRPDPTRSAKGLYVYKPDSAARSPRSRLADVLAELRFLGRVDLADQLDRLNS